MAVDYELGLYEKSMPNTLSIHEKLTIAKQAGYDSLELSIDETEEKLERLAWTSAQIHTINTWQATTGMPIRSICLSAHRKYPLGSLNGAVISRSLEIMERAVDVADALGVRIIQLAGYDIYYGESTRETRLQFAANLGKAVNIAAKKGVLLGFETMETPFMDTVEKSMEWVRAIHSPYLQIYPDIGNLTNAARLYQTDVIHDLMQGRGHLVAAHLKETKPGHYREIPYGEGHVDFESTIAACRKLGVRRFVGEFWCVDEHWRETISQNHDFLRNRISAAMAQ